MTDRQLSIPLIEARCGVMLDGAECVAAYDRLVARWGADEAGTAWSEACREADARAGSRCSDSTARQAVS